jgi:hypothetical protein
MSGCCGDKPTVTSFLEEFRLLTLYYPTKQNLRGSNCDNEGKNVVLTTFSLSMKSRFNEMKEKMKERKQQLQDVLLKGIEHELSSLSVIDLLSQVTECDPNTKIGVLDKIIYICGYIVHCFRKKGRRQNSIFGKIF